MTICTFVNITERNLMRSIFVSTTPVPDSGFWTWPTQLVSCWIFGNFPFRFCIQISFTPRWIARVNFNIRWWVNHRISSLMFSIFLDLFQKKMRWIITLIYVHRAKNKFNFRLNFCLGWICECCHAVLLALALLFGFSLHQFLPIRAL